MHATKVSSVRIIWKCKCGARAYDYVSTRRCTGEDKWGCPRYADALVTRVHADGVERDMTWDLSCSTCGRHRRGTYVVGRVTEHTCDARCLSATGGQCECSCGGKNHGSAYL